VSAKNPMKYRLAVYKRNVSNDWSYYTVGLDDHHKDDPSSARVSDFLEVEFPPLPVQEQVENQLACLNSAEEVLRAKFAAALDSIINERQKLLSLPNLVQP
jgi:hypothetical protein